MKPTSTIHSALSENVLTAAGDDGLAADMAAFYAGLDGAVAAHRPTCWNKGACCKFGEFGHKLYVTSVELAYFVRGERERWRTPTDVDACPYQSEGVCNAREHRPMGCRVFFCDPTAQHWQNGEYEVQLAKLKVIGERHGVDYRYVEWLSGLAAVSEAVGMGAEMGPKSGEKMGNSQSIDPRGPVVIELTQVRKADSHR